MKPQFGIIGCVILLSLAAGAAPKPHVVVLGGWTSIWLRGEDTPSQPLQLKVRPLYVDGRAKEFTTGHAHDVTERTFVVQQMYRVNDSLPQQAGSPQWQWQRGGWLLVDRLSGRVQPIALPDFDPDSSAMSWFRDYAAYCGAPDSGQKFFAVIMQIGRRKPLFKKPLGDATQSQSTCAPPLWERNPMRVTFTLNPDQKLTFEVKKRAVEMVAPDESEGGE